MIGGVERCQLRRSNGSLRRGASYCKLIAAHFTASVGVVAVFFLLFVPVSSSSSSFLLLLLLLLIIIAVWSKSRQRRSPRTHVSHARDARPGVGSTSRLWSSLEEEDEYSNEDEEAGEVEREVNLQQRTGEEEESGEEE